MNQNNGNQFRNSFVFVILVVAGLACSNPNNSQTTTVTNSDKTTKELQSIDTLLRDSAFALEMAKSLDSAYYIGVGQTPPPFLSPEEETAFVSAPVKQEKTATNLAGFYALECGLGLLSAQTSQTPVALLEKIAGGTIDSGASLVLNRFANATWKAGQPFRALNRITRYNFISASVLSREEVEKDAVQIRNAATKLLSSLQPVKDSGVDGQMQAIRRLLQDTAYAVEMATYLDSTYATSQGQKPTPFLTAADDTATVRKSVREQKIAINLAGFYALECGLNYLVTAKKLQPSVVLEALANDTLNKEDKTIFARFANATWKAGQPFRGLNRITRATFTPFYFLSEADIEKDLVQVRAAAKKVLAAMKL